MSAATFQRFRVSATDFDRYDIIVEAVSRELAIKKAKRIYHLNGLGDVDASGRLHSGLWSVEPLVAEVLS